MGIDISAKLIYGCNYSDLPEEILEEVDEMLDDGSLEYASPYYDAPREEWIVGVEADDSNAINIVFVEMSKEEFSSLEQVEVNETENNAIDVTSVIENA